MAAYIQLALRRSSFRLSAFVFRLHLWYGIQKWVLPTCLSLRTGSVFPAHSKNSACSDRHYHHFFRLYGSRSLLYTAVVCSAPSFFFCRGAYEYIRLSRDNALPLHLREANHIHPVCVIYCFPDTISTKNLFGPAHWLPFIDRFWSCNKSMKPIDKTLLIC